MTAAAVSRVSFAPKPAAFAFVMATGIVAVAARQQGLPGVWLVAFGIAAAAWIVLTAGSALRLARDAERLGAEMRDHRVAPGFLTAVAGTGVIAANAMLAGPPLAWSEALAAWAALLWFVLTYGIFAALTTRREKPSLEAGLNGGWLLTVVACQSVAVVFALLAAREAQPARMDLNFAALAFWLFGGMLYLWIIALIFYRYLFLRFAPGDLGPAWWINMGAMAISTLAGALLAANTAEAPWLQGFTPFIEGLTVLCWATATWWLPLLIALTVWRYAIRRDAFGDAAFDWSMVFPLGMYSAATHQMQNALHVPFLEPVASAFCWIAIGAWALTALSRLRPAFSRS
jgi:tellurite resistance protein TehA-like permease